MTWRLVKAYCSYLYEHLCDRYIYYKYIKVWTTKQKLMVILSLCYAIAMTVGIMRSMYVYRCLINCEPVYNVRTK